MVILGIDPGTTSIGYAVLKTNEAVRLLNAGLIPIKSQLRDSRLEELYRGLWQIIKKYEPDVAALERIFFSKNQKTALSVAEARGVVMLTTRLAGLKVYEYTPLEVKKTIAGNGRADKIQLIKMVNLTLPLEAQKLKAQDDVFDAIAVALTCFFLDGRSITKNTPK